MNKYKIILSVEDIETSIEYKKIMTLDKYLSGIKKNSKYLDDWLMKILNEIVDKEIN